MMKPKTKEPPTSTARKSITSASARKPPGQPYLPGKAKTPRKPDGKFEKGYQPSKGRAKGQRNRVTKLLKEAILEAAELVGQDGRGKGGLVGFLMHLAVKEKAIYARLLEKVLPMQVELRDTVKPVYTAEEAVARLRERKLPVPPSLLALVGPQEGATAIAHSFGDEEFDVDQDADE